MRQSKLIQCFQLFSFIAVFGTPSLAMAESAFDGHWENGYGVKIRINQFGSSSAAVLDESKNQAYMIEFGTEQAIPSNFIQAQKYREIRSTSVDIIQNGTYKVDVFTSEDVATVAGPVSAELSIPGTNSVFSVKAWARAVVQKKSPSNSECQGIFRPRLLAVSITDVAFEDASTKDDVGLMSEIKSYLKGLGIRALKGLSYTDVFTEIEETPAETGSSKQKCGTLEQEPSKKIAPTPAYQSSDSKLVPAVR